MGVTALRSQREACSFVSVKREEEEENQESKQSMEVGQLQRQYVEYTTSLFREGFLDSQFTQLQQLQDESNPDFVVEVVSLFFEDSERLLNDLNKALDQKGVDFKKVDGNVHQLKGSSSRCIEKLRRSIGANRVKNACVAFRNYCEEQNTEACFGCLQQVKQEYVLVKNKLETLFGLEQKILAAGGSVPMME
ncbi:unnamed protein product [Camellia sinensis]